MHHFALPVFWFSLFGRNRDPDKPIVKWRKCEFLACISTEAVVSFRTKSLTLFQERLSRRWEPSSFFRTNPFRSSTKVFLLQEGQ